MAFEFKEISAEKLDACMKLLDDMYDDLNLDLPIDISFDRSRMFMDESRDIYFFILFFGGGFVSPNEKYILEQAGPYVFDPNAEFMITPYHWPALVGMITPDYATLFTYFEFAVNTPVTKHSEWEFVIASLSIASKGVESFIKVTQESHIPLDVANVIKEVLVEHRKLTNLKGWTINIDVSYNFNIDMLKGLHNKDWMES